MTHRQFSRNASSSRAIPIDKLIEDIIKDPAVPMFWGKNQKGMQAGEEHNEPLIFPLPQEVVMRNDHETLSKIHESMYGKINLTREEAWSYAMVKAVQTAQSFSAAGYHKQLANRLLEPFAHINVLVTATEYSNFFALRDHKDAEPHIQVLAREMKKAMTESEPYLMADNEWHLPFIDNDKDIPPAWDSGDLFEYLKKLSVARCARVSYLTHDGKTPDPESDIELHDRLVGAVPLHASPAEHVCTPSRSKNANLKGWRSYRKSLPNECQ